MTVAIVLGTRPEIIKMAPIVHELSRKKIPFRLIHTGQHYSYNMSQVFLGELGLRRRIEFLDIGGGTQAEQTAKALVGLEKMFSGRTAEKGSRPAGASSERRPPASAGGRSSRPEPPSIVLVEGDTNTVLAGALSACKLGVPVGHVEAGLRSYDLRMPEEYNRRVADHLSTHLYAPTLDNAGTLVGERVPGEVFVTGNTVIDACLANLPAALQKSDALARMDLEPNGYALATVHRAENVDDPKTLGKLIDIFEGCPLPVVLPLHPRTVKNARRFGLWKRLRPSKNISVVEPVGYWDFLALMKGSGLVLTDSGGIQEEVTAPNIRRKCFVLRTSTERQEAIRAGFCELAGVEPSGALMAVRKWWDGGARVPNRASPFGRGDSAGKIVRILMKKGFC